MKKQDMRSDRIQIIVERDEVNQFNDQHRKTKKLPVTVILLLVWIALYFGSMIFGFEMGFQDGNFKPSYILKWVSRFIEESYNLFLGAGDTGNIGMFYGQYLGVSLAGAALAACGTAFQGTFKNVMAGPSTMGVMSGGSIGGLIYVLVFTTGNYGMYFWEKIGNPAVAAFLGRYIQQFLILAGCFGGVLLILAVATIAGKGKVSSSAMILCGMVFSGVTSNILMLAQYLILARDPDSTISDSLYFLMLGSFDKLTDIKAVVMMGIPILICLFVLILTSGTLNLLSFGEAEAETMGIRVRRYRNLMILVGTILTAMVVSFCGRIGFVGFMVPLITRKLTGPDLRKLLPASMAAGAIVLLIVFLIGRLLAIDSYPSVITGPLGCAVMLVVLLRKGGKSHETGQREPSPGMGIR